MNALEIEKIVESEKNSEIYQENYSLNVSVQRIWNMKGVLIA